MSKVDFLRKLTSRKFWMALASFVTMLMTATGTSAEGAEKIAALIMAGATVIAYIIGEGWADSAHAGDLDPLASPVPDKPPEPPTSE